MDSTAISLCMDNNLPIIVFDSTSEGQRRRAVVGDEIGTVVESTDSHRQGAPPEEA